MVKKIEKYKEFGFDEKLVTFSEEICKSLKDKFESIDETYEINQLKVIRSMQDCKVSTECFNISTGYGYDDIGRDTLEEVYAKVFNTQSALVRPQITCGTHALSIALFGLLRPGDTLFSPCGKPYDTLEEVIGIRESLGSLKEYNINYKQVDLKEDYGFDFDKIKESLNEKSIKVATIQRSKGYQTRPSFSVSDIASVIKFIKDIRSDVVVMVDNCYGEFVERLEPSDVGADLVVGSLIKNPGGGLAPIGGYIAGKRELIDKCACRMNCPGLGREVGASLDTMKSFYQGLFFAPSVVASALKTAIFAAACFEKLGFEVVPSSDVIRTDIIQSILLKSEENLISFCKGIQKGAPVDSHVTPMPWDMPGYDAKVIMAAGAFNQGSSIELSSDGPLKEPYAVFFQGGLNFAHGKTGIMMAIQTMLDDGLVSL